MCCPPASSSQKAACEPSEPVRAMGTRRRATAASGFRFSQMVL